MKKIEIELQVNAELLCQSKRELFLSNYEFHNL